MQLLLFFHAHPKVKASTKELGMDGQSHSWGWKNSLELRSWWFEGTRVVKVQSSDGLETHCGGTVVSITSSKEVSANISVNIRCAVCFLRCRGWTERKRQWPAWLCTCQVEDAPESCK